MSKDIFLSWSGGKDRFPGALYGNSKSQQPQRGRFDHHHTPKTYESHQPWHGVRRAPAAGAGKQTALGLPLKKILILQRFD